MLATLILLAGWASSPGGPAAPAQLNLFAAGWEYKAIPFPDSAPCLDDTLGPHRRRGWELVGVVGTKVTAPTGAIAIDLKQPLLLLRRRK